MVCSPAGRRLYKDTTASTSFPSPHRYSVDAFLDSPLSLYPPARSKLVRRIMEERSEKKEKVSPHPQIDPERYVRHPMLLQSLTSERT